MANIRSFLRQVLQFRTKLPDSIVCRKSRPIGAAAQPPAHQDSELSIKIISFIFILATIILIIYAVSHPSTLHQPQFPTININVTEGRHSPTYIHPQIATIVESRATDHLIAVVHNVNHHIPSSWPIQIFYSKDNEHFIRNSTLAPLIENGKIILTFMTVTYGRDQTASLLTDPNFWRSVRGEKVLFFQSDSIMCSNSPHRVTDYLQYDYVGGPWDLSFFTFDQQYRVGNGGFSIRTRSKILALIALIKPDPTMPEDVWYAQNMRHVNGSIPSIEVAKTFAVESMYYERPVGVHRFPWHCKFRADLAKTCPESMLIMYDVCPREEKTS